MFKNCFLKIILLWNSVKKTVEPDRPWWQYRIIWSSMWV